MPSEATSAEYTIPRLSPQQVCFVVEDVTDAVNFCEKRFGWGPFYQFKAPVPEATYKDWRGAKLTEVALGMAGKVQVEFLHVFEGQDTTGDYQAKYGTGLQHLGIHCLSRDEALEHLVSQGASVNELNEYPGIRFAFVDVPTGDGMFEILQPTAEMANDEGISGSREQRAESSTLFDIDRATIVTADIDKALSFYSETFGWTNAQAVAATLSINGSQTSARRYVGEAGKLQLEFIEPCDPDAGDPYAAHLRRGDHGLIHASGLLSGDFPVEEVLCGKWLETGESFALYSWSGGKHSLQIRRVPT
ncbi:MAG: VOC family protein [Halioglobus sp.]